MRKRDEYEWLDEADDRKRGLIVLILILVVLLIVTGIYFAVNGFERAESAGAEGSVSEQSAKSSETTVEETKESTVESLPQQSSEDKASGEQSTEESAPEASRQVLMAGGVTQIDEITLGIDVSKYQGNIDWAKVAAAGIDFAIVRVGNRTLEDGRIVEDSSARYNLQEAAANGIALGAYFFSTAVTEEEALEEAEWTAELIAGYPITYPVVYDCERFEKPESRQHGMSVEARTALAECFLQKIYEYGYTPMFYGGRNELAGDNQWITSELEKQYKIWVSWYPEKPYPETADPGYGGACDMWQYSNTGAVDGIVGPVDLNVAYFGYDGIREALGEQAPEQVGADAEAGHLFYSVDETVTAKDATNLRNVPSQGADSTVMLTLQNGQTALRTGVSDSGWSRLEYQGETYYAVSSLLTTDLTVKQPAPVEEDDGIKTVFTPCEEQVSPKIEVNLRSIPSVTNAEASVVATAKYGEVFRRTGINTDLGWSRVEYNGQTLYCVSSYIYVIENAQE